MGRKGNSRTVELARPTATEGDPRILWLMLGIVVAGLLVRFRANSESFSYDELYTIGFHASRSWWSIIGQGTYSPNNHILSTLIIKLTATLTDSLTPFPDSPLPVMLTTHNTLNFRLGAILAGALLPAALAWRSKGNIGVAGIVGFLALGHPWLIAFSTEARGYALLLLFAALATNCLASFENRFSWQYVAAMTAAIYTVPIAGEVLLGHALAMVILHRAGLKRWALAAGVVVALSTGLYLPFIAGIFRQIGAADVLQQAQSPWEYVYILLQHVGMGWQSGVAWGATGAALVLLVGLPLAWRLTEWRAALVTYATATAVAMLTAGFVANLRAPRFALWIAPLFVFAGAGVLYAAWTTRAVWLRVAAGAVGLALVAGLIRADARVATMEAQPIYGALAIADQSLEDRSEMEAVIVSVYMSAQENVLYWKLLRHNMELAYSVEDFQKLEDGRELRIVVAWPDFMAANEPKLRKYILAHYFLLQRLPGRISPVDVYGPAGKR